MIAASTGEPATAQRRSGAAEVDELGDDTQRPMQRDPRLGRDQQPPERRCRHRQAGCEPDLGANRVACVEAAVCK